MLKLKEYQKNLRKFTFNMTDDKEKLLAIGAIKKTFREKTKLSRNLCDYGRDCS